MVGLAVGHYGDRIPAPAHTITQGKKLEKRIIGKRLSEINMTTSLLLLVGLGSTAQLPRGPVNTFKLTNPAVASVVQGMC